MMKYSLILITTILMNVCYFCCNEKDIQHIEFVSYNLRDTLYNFIDETGTFNHGTNKTVYSVDIALNSKDTLISFWAAGTILATDYPFNDSRFLLQLRNKPHLIRHPNWMQLYDSLVVSNQDFVPLGAYAIDSMRYVSITYRNLKNHNLINLGEQLDTSIYNDLYSELKDQQSKYIDDDTKPFVKIYKIVNKDSLALLFHDNLSHLFNIK